MPTGNEYSSQRRRAVHNTSDRDEVRAFGYGMILGGNPVRDIEQQEAGGQRSVIHSDTLPSRGYDRAPLEAAGVAFGEPVPGDPLFVYATLPDGWRKVATGHSLYSKLLDDQGRVRATIMYKAAFYDRDASLSVARRFRPGIDYSEGVYQRQKSHREYVAIVTDGDVDCGGRVIWRQTFADPEGANKYADDGAYNRANEAGSTWLDKHYPEWLDATAYWDLPPVEALP